MSSLLKKLSVSTLYQNSRSQTATESVWSVSNLSTESVVSRRELVVNCVHTADATQLEFRRVGGVYWALQSHSALSRFPKENIYKLLLQYIDRSHALPVAQPTVTKHSFK